MTFKKKHHHHKQNPSHLSQKKLSTFFRLLGLQELQGRADPIAHRQAQQRSHRPRERRVQRCGRLKTGEEREEMMVGLGWTPTVCVCVFFVITIVLFLYFCIFKSVCWWFLLVFDGFWRFLMVFIMAYRRFGFLCWRSCHALEWWYKQLEIVSTCALVRGPKYTKMKNQTKPPRW